MRFDLELTGVTASGQKVTMQTSVYARAHEQLRIEVEKAAAAGPWLDEAGGELLPTGDGTTVTVEHVRAIPRQERG